MNRPLSKPSNPRARSWRRKAIGPRVLLLAVAIPLIGATNGARALDGVCVKFCDDGPRGGSSSSSSGSGRSYRGPTREEQRDNLHAQGFAAYQSKDYARAIRLFEEALGKAYSPVTEIMLGKSRLWLAISTAQTAYTAGDPVRALAFRREALKFAEAILQREPSDNARENVRVQREWIRQLEPYGQRHDEDRRWTGAMEATRGRVSGVLDDLQNKIQASPDFQAPGTAVSTTGGLGFMAPGSTAFQAKPEPAQPAAQWPSVDPAEVRGAPDGGRSLAIKDVPAPTAAAITDAWVRMNQQKPPEMILEALENGQGDLATSVRYMQDRLDRLNPHDREARQALSYLEALQQAESVHLNARARAAASGDARYLVDAILAHDAGDTAPAASDAGANPAGGGNWRYARDMAVKRAVDASGGDVDAAIALLARSEDATDAAGKAAWRFLQGLAAFRHWTETQKK